MGRGVKDLPTRGQAVEKGVEVPIDGSVRPKNWTEGVVIIGPEMRTGQERGSNSS